MFFKIGYSKTMKIFSNTDYDTSITIEQKSDSQKQTTNCFQISKLSEIFIAPFSFFRIDQVIYDDYEQTADVKLTLLGTNENDLLSKK